MSLAGNWHLQFLLKRIKEVFEIPFNDRSEANAPDRGCLKVWGVGGNHVPVEGKAVVNNRNTGKIEITTETEDPRSGQSLVPMLIGGLVLIVVGMALAMALS